MLISHQHQFIYLKTHKTASTSVEAALETLCTSLGHVPQHTQDEIQSDLGYISGRMGGESHFLPAHARASQIEKRIGKAVFEKYTKVYTVRNPYDKVVSWFWHVMPERVKVRIKNDFDDTLVLFEDWLEMRPILPKDVEIYRTDSGVFPAETIRFEELTNDLMKFSEKIGATVDLAALPRWKSETRWHKDRSFMEYYSPSTKRIVRRHFAFDFANFGYEP